MEPQFIEPTAASRFKLALCGGLGLGLSLAMDHWWAPFMAFVRALPPCESLPWLRGVALTFVSLGLLAALSAARAAVLTIRSAQSPFPGAWVWSRTRIKHGWKARADGYLWMVIALAMAVGPAVGLYFLDVLVIFCWPASCGC